jgi:hypothetical protein
MNWPLDDSVTDGILEQRLFPKEQAVSAKRMPDYEYIRKELLRNGVNKKLLSGQDQVRRLQDQHPSGG